MPEVNTLYFIVQNSIRENESINLRFLYKNLLVKELCCNFAVERKIVNNGARTYISHWGTKF
jgi:hypothetical protein